MPSEKKMLRDIQRAISDFDMIQDWDTILLWVSGGKDSMYLGYAMSQLQKRMKNKFKIIWVYMFKEFLIDCDINFLEKKKYYEEELGIPLEKVDIKLPEDSKVNNDTGVKQTCQWCAYARRISMMKLCQKHWATKIMLWHHMDDVVVTTFMNITQWRKFQVMAPKNKLNSGKLSFIRPMVYLREKDIMNHVLEKNIPYSGCNCPVWEDWMRNKIKKEILWENEKVLPWFIENSFWAFMKEFQAKYKELDYMT